MLGAGYSYRRAYRPDTFVNRQRIDMLEVVADHFMHESSVVADELTILADHFPIVPHGLDLSLGSADGLDDAYLERFAEVVVRARAPWWSDHVAFTRAGGVSIGHLAPLPFTREALDVLERNVARARARIGDLPVILENIAAPMRYSGAEMDEATFLTELVKRTGCLLLLDIENLSANVHNHGGDAEAFLDALPADAVAQLHLAGGEWVGDAYVDSHGAHIHEEVWRLASLACERFPIKAIVVERDERLPAFSEILGEVERARALGVGANRWR